MEYLSRYSYSLPETDVGSLARERIKGQLGESKESREASLKFNNVVVIVVWFVV